MNRWINAICFVLLCALGVMSAAVAAWVIAQVVRLW